MGAVRPQTPHRSPRQAFGGNFQYGLPAASAEKTTHLNFFLHDYMPEICGSFGLAKTSIAQWTPVAPRISASACNTWLAACGRWADDAKRLAFVAFQLDAQLARIRQVALVGFVDHVNNWPGF